MRENLTEKRCKNVYSIVYRCPKTYSVLRWLIIQKRRKRLVGVESILESKTKCARERNNPRKARNTIYTYYKIVQI